MVESTEGENIPYWLTIEINSFWSVKPMGGDSFLSMVQRLKHTYRSCSREAKVSHLRSEPCSFLLGMQMENYEVLYDVYN